MKVFRHLLWWVAFSASCVVGAFESTATAAEHTIRFTTEPTPVGLIHWWAEEKGIFAKHGLKYTDTIVSTAYIGLQGNRCGDQRCCLVE